MDGLYEVESTAFFSNRLTGVSLYHGVALKRSRQPVVIKRHDIYLGRNKTEFLEDFCSVLNVGLAQARVEHLHTCKIIEFRMDIDRDRNCYSIYHVLEEMERDLGADLEARKQPATEEELKKFLQQTSAALAYAHSKEISHRDLKPGNIFVDRDGNFKVGDFGSFHQQTSTVSAQTVTGTMPYMSPQLREVFSGLRPKYDPYKHDVFGLGMTGVSLATHSVIMEPWPVHELQDRVRTAVSRYSQSLQQLLTSMLAVEEASRPTMHSIATQLCGETPVAEHLPAAKQEPVQPSPKSPVQSPSELADVTASTLRFFSVQTNTWKEPITFQSQIQVDSFSRWAVAKNGSVFCCGGGEIPHVKKTAYVLDGDGAVSIKADMKTARQIHGVVAAQACYVFGGGKCYLADATGWLKSCEKFDLGSNVWQPLPNMREGRIGFNPCDFQGVIYLCGAGSSILEAFSPATDSFLPFHLSIPQLSGHCCLLVDNDQLVVYSEKYIHKLAAEPSGQLILQKEVSSAAFYKDQNSHPVTDQTRGVFFLVCRSVCVYFNLETGAVGEIIR